MKKNNNKKNNKQNDNKKVINKFLKVFLTSIAIFLVIGSLITGGYIYLLSQYDGDDLSFINFSGFGKNRNESGKGIKENLTFAFFGVDEDGYRPDSLMVGIFNTKTKNLDIVSIPRDTRIELPDRLYATLRERRSDTPRVMKINAVSAYSHPDKRNEYAVEALESLVPIKIDYYIKLNLESFKKVVDMIGGVEITVPQNMVYSDPYQNLYINLKAGRQVLNGAQAEQLVRFRSGYGDQDLGRIRMQQEFMKEFSKQILTDRNILNLTNILSTALEQAETNFEFNDVLQYMQFANDFDVEKLEMATLPGQPRTVGGVSYFVMDEEGTIELFEEIKMKNKPIDKKTEKEEPKLISSVGKNIEVLNSTTIGGIAGETRDLLREKGFTVVNVGNFLSGALNTTKIIVREENMGEDLKEFFNNPVVEVDNQLSPSNIDIRIILGTNQ
ncbi:LytR family transcriptional attenuator [Natranaerovirga pectinivora]|uniref:LytR family transcriptional attenuator n=1 Tax=Natranaerovirga pectinivora TaxID=682400 RepID=A0A4R3MKH7_9FIRM|nr:LCP family protein [Natranaerovirga pectinivora]TCT14106.1 LytR family transcriptional attenuator [Natranaerovirga pectinivora]